MPVIDRLLNSLIKYLQKKQKKRNKFRKRIVKARSLAEKRKAAAKKEISKNVKREKGKVKNKISKKRYKKSPPTTIFRRKKVPKRKSVKRPKVKRTKSKAVKKKSLPSKKEARSSNEIKVGVVTHYFSKIRVIVIKMTGGKLTVGDKVHIKGRAADFTQEVKSLQIESIDVNSVKKGQLAGLRVNKKSKEGDQVFKIV